MKEIFKINFSISLLNIKYFKDEKIYIKYHFNSQF